jgi:hypothetical protein
MPPIVTTAEIGRPAEMPGNMAALKQRMEAG